MKKYLKIILTIFIIIGNIGCSVTDETTGYFLESVAIVTGPIWYPFVQMKENMRTAAYERKIKKPLKGTPGKTKTTGYLEGYLWGYIEGEYVNIEITCDEKGFFQELKAYYLNGKIAYEAKYEKGIPTLIKKYYDDGKIYRVYKGDGTQLGNMILEYDEIGRVVLDDIKNFNIVYDGDIRKMKDLGEPNDNCSAEYYSTGAPKKTSSAMGPIAKEERKKFYKEKEFLKDWEEIRGRDNKTKHNGKYKIYSPNKKLYADFNFKNGYLDGIQKQYYWNSDKLYSVENWQNGKEIGTHKYYYLSGKIKSIVEYNPQKNTIIEKYYNLLGRLERIDEYNYKRGNLNLGDRVKSTEYFSNGQIKSIEFEHSYGDKGYYMDGKLKYEEVKEKIEGSKEKEVVKKWYYYDGTVKELEAKLIAEKETLKRINLLRKYYPNGNLSYEEREYVDDNIQIERYYDETGKLLKEKKEK